MRVLTGVAIAAFFLSGLTILLLREVIVPRVHEYRPQIVAALEHAIGLPVSIESLSADWQGLRPRLHLAGLTVRDRAGDAALRMERVDGTLAWSSLVRGQAYFHLLEIFAPELSVRREVGGQIFVAGVRIDPGGDGSAFSEWLIGQREIMIRGVSLAWYDLTREAPPLRLESLDLRLWNVGARHRLGIRARPSAELASELDLRGDLVSATPEDPSTWAGQLYLALEAANLGAWQQWVDFPVPLSGFGGVRAWVDVRDGQVDNVVGTIALDDVVTRLDENLPEWVLKRARGRLEVHRTRDGFDFSAREFELVSGSGQKLAVPAIHLNLREWGDERDAGGSLDVNRLDLDALAHLAAHLPVDEGLRERLAQLRPQGRLEDLRVEWKGDPAQPREWSVRTRFAGVGIQPHGAIPGFSGLSGEVDGNQQRGRYRLTGQDALLAMPQVFPEPRLALPTVHAEGGWMHRDGRLEIALDGARFENPDAAGSASGLYRPVSGGRGEIDLAARLTRADAVAVWRYLPYVVNEETRSWLRRSLTSGTVPEARLRLKGDLDEFPFTGQPDGQFLVTVKVAGARLNYAPGWPAIRDINGELRFEGAGMQIAAQSGRIYGVKLSKVVADVPDLDARDGEIMTLRGRANGATEDFLRFIRESPVTQRIDGFTDHMHAEGNGTLDLTIVMPLQEIEQSGVKGEYRFSANRLAVLDDLPSLTQATGRVSFTESELLITDASAQLFGEPLRLSARTPADGGVRFAAQGGAAMRALREVYDFPALEHLSGSAAWTADIDFRAEGLQVAFSSDLGGISSSLPAPMNKRAVESWPLEVRHEFDKRSGREQTRLNLRDRVDMQLERRLGDGGWLIERGGVGVFRPAKVVDDGVLISAVLEDLDVDAWRRALAVADPERTDPLTLAGSAKLVGIDLRVGRALAMGQVLSQLELDAFADSGGWKGRISSGRIDGVFDWRSAEQGALRARLKRLSIDREDDAGSGQDGPIDEPPPPRHLPELDIVAEEFQVRGVELGQLTVRARNADGLWMLDALALQGPNGRLQGSGQWRPGRLPLTELEFQLQSGNLGNLLDQLGYEGVMEAGSADMGGRIQWQGAPTRIDHPSLSGAFDFEALKGQFRKLKPGVGRLLGVLSLQSLPRRLSLDFRDVFSEGFVFDRISGSISMNSGVMHTENLHIAGPAARIWITGFANVEHETQDLRVLVQPTLSESIAVGAAAGMINPLAGVVTYLAQKVLSDPIERMFAFQYAISGGWADPVVEKLAGGGRPPEKRPDGGVK